MKERDIALSIVLTIITCGIYGIYWFICLTDEVGELKGQKDTSGALSFLLNLITCGIYGVYWAYKLGKDIYLTKLDKDMNTSDESLVYLVLQVTGFNIIVLALAQNEVNQIVRTN